MIFKVFTKKKKDMVGSKDEAWGWWKEKNHWCGIKKYTNPVD